VARLANGREIWVPIAPHDTAEWAWTARREARGAARQASRVPQRPRPRGLPRTRVSRRSPPARTLPGDGVALQGLAGRPATVVVAGRLARRADRAFDGRIARLGVRERRGAPVPGGGYPRVSLFQVRRGIGPAWVVESLRRLPDEARVLDCLRAPTRLGIDARREALATERDAAGLVLPAGSRSSAADVAKAEGGRMVIRAAGPGLLVVAEGWDPGWSYSSTGAAPASSASTRTGSASCSRRTHRVVLRHHARGFGAGVALALARCCRSAPGPCAGAPRFDPFRSRVLASSFSRTSIHDCRQAGPQHLLPRVQRRRHHRQPGDRGSPERARDHQRLRGDRDRGRQPRPHRRPARRDDEGIPLAQGRPPREEPGLRRCPAKRLRHRLEGARLLHGRGRAVRPARDEGALRGLVTGRRFRQRLTRSPATTRCTGS